MPRKKRDRDDSPVGVYYEGLPVLAIKIRVTNTGDGLSNAMSVTPVKIDDGSKHFVSMEIGHSKTIYENVFSKDDPDDLIGYNLVYQFTGMSAVFDDRPDAEDQVRAMEGRLAEKAAEETEERERTRRRARGEFSITEVPPTDQEMGLEDD
jgi:hypothetical protein